MKSCTWRRTKERFENGFTLIELTVAVAIMGILAALLFAGLGKMRERAQMTGDLSNLRNIAVAFVQYVAEHNNNLPPVTGPTVPNYAQEYLAAQMGMTVSLRDPKVPKAALGVWISPADQAKPPGLSALRSYSVNFYMGAIKGVVDNKTALKFSQLVAPSRTLYFLPGEGGEKAAPDSQARFSENTYPFKEDSPYTMRIRLYDGTVTPALWADGHVSMLTLEQIRRDGKTLLFPKSPFK